MNGDRHGPVPVVTFHCTRCHHADYDDWRVVARCPGDRALVSRQARRHMKRCEGSQAIARADLRAAEARKFLHGIPVPADPVGLAIAACRDWRTNPAEYPQHSSCSQVRIAREQTAAWHKTQ